MPWDYILSAIGLTGFFLAGKKLWWSWYINVLNQVFWAIYSITTEQWGFMIATAIYFCLFSRNAYLWTRERFSDNPDFVAEYFANRKLKFFSPSLWLKRDLQKAHNDEMNRKVIGQATSVESTPEGIVVTGIINDPGFRNTIFAGDLKVSLGKPSVPIYSNAAGFCEAVIDGLVCGQESCATVHMTEDGHDYVK